MRSPGHGRHRAHNQMDMDFNSDRYSHSLRSQKRSLSPHRMDDSRRMECLDERSDFIERREYCRGVGLVCHDGPYEQKSPSYGQKPKQPRLDLEVDNRDYRNHRMDDSRRMECLDERSDFIERREYCRGVGLVCHDGPYEQKSPSYGQKVKQPHLDLEVDNRDYRNHIKYEQEPLEPRDNNFVDGERSYHKNFYRNEHNDSKLAYGNEVNYNRKRSPSSLNWKKDQKSWMGDTNKGESYQPYQNVPSTLYYGKTRIQVPTSRNVDMELSEYERIKYPGQVPSEKLTFVESHEDKERLVFDSSEAALHHRVTGFDYRDLRNSNEITELGRSSSKLARNKGLDSYQAREIIASSQDISRRHDEYDAMHRVGFKAYEQRPVDSVIDSDERNRSANYHQRGVCSPRNEREDYFYSKLRGTATHAHEYAQGSKNKRIHLHADMDYSLEQSEDDYRAPIIMDMDTTVERHNDIAGSYASLRRSSMMEGHTTLPRNSISDYRDMGRARISIKQDGRFTDAPDDHVEVVSRVPQDYRMSHLDDSQHSRVSRMKTEYEYGREEKLKFQEEKFHEELSSHPVSMYEPNHRSMDWLQTREEYDSYKQADRDSLHGSKYTHEKERRTTYYRITMSGEYRASREYDDLYSNDRDIIAMDSTKETRFKNEKNRNSKRTYDQRESFQSDDLLPSQEYHRHKQMQSSEAHKNRTRFMKGNTKHGSLSGNSSRHFERRNRDDKNHIVWERIEYCHDDVHENDYDDNQLEEMNGPADPPENSEEFIKLVLDAFLQYSKQLNFKASIRKRYKGQGKGGSLYCIVCGLSLSKEFMDTQSLLRHAFMSRKAGLRAQHFGLLKAVCVMLGWNFVVPRNVVTWTPEVLPSAEALAQKEDLIIWPPIVVVRNISLLDNSPDNWRLVTTEALEALLRSKGFIRGSVKVCLGRPADQSVVVVKFIGTFSGLGDAERIHRYFEQNKRGRAEFEKITRRRRKNTNGSVVISEGEKIEEQVLFGYMGIAEDLDEVDFKANKSSVIKSKKEIYDWANGPIRPDERQ